MIGIENLCGHPNPAWRDQADSFVMYDLTDSGMPGHWEQLPAKRLGGGRYMLCSIPLSTLKIALGDIVTTTSSGRFVDSVDAVTERSGNVVIHAVFHKNATIEGNEDPQDDLIRECRCLGIDYEVHEQPGHVALSCPVGSPEHVEIEKRLHAYHLLEWGYFVTSERSKPQDSAS
ncbi:DUF4265 domain-containing protein [Streptomyces sp. NPDC056304]|uniref:DUF4265 domain-containing protein n=1 Tax=Streptomyces sp. NPDC056304 TaxID=3345778 RepID=UPI0035DA1B1E